MSRLAQLFPITPLRSQIALALKAEGGKARLRGSASDRKTLANVGKCFEAEHVALLTGNVAVTLLLLNTLPKNATHVWVANGETLELSRTIVSDPNGSAPHAHIGIYQPGSIPADRSLLLVFDVSDVADHSDAFGLFLSRAVTCNLVLTGTTVSIARVFLDRLARAGHSIELLPSTRGAALVGRSSTTGDAADAQARDAWIELCAESQWLPRHRGRVTRCNGTLGGPASDDLIPVNRSASFSAIRALRSRLTGFRGASPALAEAPRPDDANSALIMRLAAKAVAMVLQTRRYLASAFDEYPQPPAVATLTDDQWRRSQPWSAPTMRARIDEIRRFLGVTGKAGQLHDIVFGECVQKCVRQLKKLDAGRPTVGKLSQLVEQLFSIRELAYWSQNWDARSNETWRILWQEDLPKGSLLPKPAKPLGEYLGYYEFRGLSSKRNTGNARTSQSASANRPLCKPLPFNDSSNHMVRQRTVVALIEYLFGVAGRRYPHETIRWLDLGCGSGRIANGVRVPDSVADRFEIVGLDYGADQVKRANAQAALNRRFIQADGLQPPAELLSTQYHIVSAFEFLEHMLDPAAFLRLYAPHCSGFFIAGSPLNENRGWQPALAHVWSFGRAGYEAIFRHAGFRINLSLEARIGTYIGGHDWVTVVGAKGDLLPRGPGAKGIDLQRSLEHAGVV
ncbi:MAG: methyltransferase domain-containing protein [Phycisphaerales bacterium]|nr:methyltransferase domain-containing protein [Phycisphaerales bacterium]MCI0631915.1 methyltransferase domain-containing protein [Phycisphaerales bacterium]MCI0676097.1 methyltransferase domain-containing protein [Phycisphaerales bacterium]